MPFFALWTVIIMTVSLVAGLANVSQLASPPRLRWPIYVALPLLAVAITLALRLGGAQAVRTDADYLLAYVILGIVWLRVAAQLLPLIGLDLRGDIAERGNTSAVPASCGALFGIAACYAGGNIGEGPGPHVVVLSSAIATAGWFALGLGAVLVARIDEGVTVDRDGASGVRYGALLACNGVVLGNAVAGRWISVEATVRDYVRLGWPALVLTALSCGLHFLLRPTPSRPSPPPWAKSVSLLAPVALTAVTLIATRVL